MSPTPTGHGGFRLDRYGSVASLRHYRALLLLGGLSHSCADPPNPHFASSRHKGAAGQRSCKVQSASPARTARPADDPGHARRTRTPMRGAACVSYQALTSFLPCFNLRGCDLLYCLMVLDYLMVLAGASERESRGCGRGTRLPTDDVA